MIRNEFCKQYWQYYLVLEKELLDVEDYIAFDLGENSLYIDSNITNYGNSLCYSNKLILLYLSICSEVDVILKTICSENNKHLEFKKINCYATKIIEICPKITNQKVEFRDFTLQPFINWSSEKSPEWWGNYNDVKHERTTDDNYKKANLKNVINSLAGLYILEQYFVKQIGDRDNDYDVPNDVSNLFKMIDYSTKNIVIGNEKYLMHSDDIDKIMNL